MSPSWCPRQAQQQPSTTIRPQRAKGRVKAESPGWGLPSATFPPPVKGLLCALLRSEGTSRVLGQGWAPRGRLERDGAGCEERGPEGGMGGRRQEPGRGEDRKRVRREKTQQPTLLDACPAQPLSTGLAWRPLLTLLGRRPLDPGTQNRRRRAGRDRPLCRPPRFPAQARRPRCPRLRCP